MKINTLMQHKDKYIISSVLLGLYSLLTVFSVLVLIYNSLRVKSDFLTNTLGIPKSFTLRNYVNLFVEAKAARYIFNSVFILIFVLTLLIGISLMTAYGIGRFKFKYKKGLLFYFLLGLMFPIQLGIIPVFIIIKNIGLFNTYWSVILVLSAGISMPVLLLTVFFKTLPLVIYESAKIDGASEWRIFYRIMVPMAASVILSICIIMSVGIWNQFFVPVVFLQSEQLKTLPLLIMSFTRKMFDTVNLALAGSVVATVPLLVIFFIFSKQILNSITSGGVKG